MSQSPDIPKEPLRVAQDSGLEHELAALRRRRKALQA